MASLGSITPRNLRFALDTVESRHWCAGDPARTAVFDALSILFPAGESFFIDSVQHFRERITDPELQKDIKSFTQQEAIHSREHLRYNRVIRLRAGDTVDRLEDAVKTRMALVKARGGPFRALAVTCALEHFTAIMSDVLLRDPRFLEGADPDYVRLWRWHAIEETEHKAVAFDVMRAVVPGWRRYPLRVIGMLITTVLFNYYVFKHLFHLLKAEHRHYSAASWGTILNQLYGRPGMFRRILLPWAAYFRPGFHPWQQDNRALIEQLKAELGYV